MVQGQQGVAAAGDLLRRHGRPVVLESEVHDAAAAQRGSEHARGALRRTRGESEIYRAPERHELVGHLGPPSRDVQRGEVVCGGDQRSSELLIRLRRIRHLARRLGASYVPAEPGRQIVGIYDRSVTTPTGKLAVIRHQDTFTLAPWRPALEPFKGRAVMGLVGPTRVTWSLDRARTLPGRG